MKVSEETLELFKQRYEDLDGQTYFAKNPKETVKHIENIFTTSKVSKPVVAPLPEKVNTALSHFLNEAQISPVEIDLDGTLLQNDISRADVGISACEFGIAFTGTVVEVTTQDAYRLVSSLPRVHIALVPAAAIINNLDEAAPRLRTLWQKYDQNCHITFISGPSRTGDIEMKLVLGVHGPQESHVIVCDYSF